MPRILSKSFITFAAIGVINTAIDVGLFVTLYDSVGLPLLVANTVSTTAALTTSYILNSRYTFNDESRMTRRKVISFVLISLSAIWILQPLLIFGALYALGAWSVFGGQFDSAIAKLFSVPFTLVWNYVLYKKVVFKK